MKERDDAESHLLGIRMTEVRDEEEELTQQVEFMKRKIQQSAIRQIQSNFGTGPVEVVLELNLGDYKYKRGTPLSILLFVDETPHAAWTWLEQIGSKAWDRSSLSWGQDDHLDLSIGAVNNDISTTRKRLDFQEKSKHSHKAWTLCAKNSIKEEGGGGGEGESVMVLYLKLQRNQIIDPYETCLGIAITSKNTIRELLFELQHTSRVTIRRAFVKQNVF